MSVNFLIQQYIGLKYSCNIKSSQVQDEKFLLSNRKSLRNKNEDKISNYNENKTKNNKNKTKYRNKNRINIK